MEILESVFGNIGAVSWSDILDITLVAVAVHYAIKKIRSSSAERLLKGVLLLIILMLTSLTLGLQATNYILENFAQLGIIALVIVFQPELRQILEKIGKTKLYRSGSDDEELTEGEIIINEICDACERLSKEKHGALMVFERDSTLKEIIDSGIKLNCKITSEVIRNIFFPKAPLHDGAVVISSGKIESASCILPLSKNLSISKDLGTRHRAGVGISETTDALCVIVSEETGAISIANKGMLKRHLNTDILRKMLRYELIPNTEKEREKGVFETIERMMEKIKKNFSRKKGE